MTKPSIISKVRQIFSSKMIFNGRSYLKMWYVYLRASEAGFVPPIGVPKDAEIVTIKGYKWHGH